MNEKKKYTQSIMCEPPNLDNILSKCIDKIWQKYDDDGNGYLDK